MLQLHCRLSWNSLLKQWLPAVEWKCEIPYKYRIFHRITWYLIAFRCGLEAEECWQLVQSFCHCHQLPPSVAFLTVCAEHGQWLALLCNAQLYSIPSQKVINFVHLNYYIWNSYVTWSILVLYANMFNCFWVVWRLQDLSLLHILVIRRWPVITESEVPSRHDYTYLIRVFHKFHVFECIHLKFTSACTCYLSHMNLFTNHTIVYPMIIYPMRACTAGVKLSVMVFWIYQFIVCNSLWKNCMMLLNCVSEA